jgi:hypothetical protein
MTTGRINQVNIFTYSQKTQKLNNNLKQTSAPHADQQSHRSLTDASTHYTKHTIMPSFVESHSSLSQKKDKNTDRSLAHSHYTVFIIPLVKIRVLYLQQAAEPDTQNNKRKQKTDTPQMRKSNILSAPPSVRVSPHNNNSANQFNFILQN